MTTLKLAWRNVFRHTRRTLITAAAISVGLSSMIFMNTMMNGVDKMASRNIIDYETGHMEIFAVGYYREEGAFPLDTIIEDPEFVIGQIETASGIKAIAQFLEWVSTSRKIAKYSKSPILWSTELTCNTKVM
jgi:putative ABC transport system permease protein